MRTSERLLALVKRWKRKKSFQLLAESVVAYWHNWLLWQLSINGILWIYAPIEWALRRKADRENLDPLHGSFDSAETVFLDARRSTHDFEKCEPVPDVADAAIISRNQPDWCAVAATESKTMRSRQTSVKHGANKR